MIFRSCAIICAAAWAMMAWGAPYIGYIYPAGGQQGTTVRVNIGGQRMGNVRDIVVSGTGVKATFVAFEGAEGPLNYRQRDFLRQRIEEIIETRKKPTAPATPAAPANPPAPATTPATPAAPANPPATPAAPPEKPKPQVTLPDLPELRDLEQKTTPELRKIMSEFVYKQKRTKPPLAEDVTLDIVIDPDAMPGDRELRLLTPGGLSNPVIFQVGSLPEIREKDYKDEKATAPPPTDAPLVLNGQVMPGEVDRFTLKLRGGQRLVIAAHARHLIPYMADAVPGWMQAVLTLYDANGKELAFADDTGIDPDPTLYYQAPQDGEYRLAIRDAIYRGREDFVYRVTIRERTPEDMLYAFATLGKAPQEGKPAEGNPLLPWVDSRLVQVNEVEPNNTTAAARKMTLPQLIKGRIAQAGDLDLYSFTGKTGETVVAEVYARRLGSPMDAVLRLIDAAGRVLAWNDDYKFGEMGLITHQADAYLSAKLPADGVYYIQVSDAQRHGGDAGNYYLRISQPQADFVLRMTPAGINVPLGGTASITVYAFRKDGWDGDIDVVVAGAAEGVTLKGAKIPAGKDQVTLTLATRGKVTDPPIVLRLEGRAAIDGQTITRPVIPCERMMQAFASYHLVPAQQLMLKVIRR